MAQPPIRLDNFAHFGDGNTALVIRKKKFVGEDGITYWEFIFRINPRIRAMYSLDDEIEPVQETIRREYPEIDVSVVDENPNHLRVWIFTDINGNPTPVSRIDDEKDMQILNLQKKIASLKLECSELQEMMRNRSVPEQAISHAANIVKQARTAAAKLKVDGGGEVRDLDEDYE